jgi:hypothetical protein
LKTMWGLVFEVVPEGYIIMFVAII